MNKKIDIVPYNMFLPNMFLKIYILRETVISAFLTNKTNIHYIILPTPIFIPQLCEGVHIEQYHYDYDKEQHIIEEPYYEKQGVILVGHLGQDIPYASPCLESFLEHEEEALQGGVAVGLVDEGAEGDLENVVESVHEGHVEQGEPHEDIHHKDDEKNNGGHLGKFHCDRAEDVK